MNTPMEVQFLDHMGSDLTVVNAARVSMSKRHAEFDQEADSRLLRYLLRHGHWSPFSHPQISFLFKAPIFVARQLHKHMVGLNITLAHNEVSRRYVDSEPEMYLPDNWRSRPDGSIKQGSGATLPPPTSTELTRYVSDVHRKLLNAYNKMILAGVAPEQARMILPQSTHTEWVWTGSLYSWLRILELRLDSHAQEETRALALEVSKVVAQYFPESFKAWETIRSEK